MPTARRGGESALALGAVVALGAAVALGPRVAQAGVVTSVQEYERLRNTLVSGASEASSSRQRGGGSGSSSRPLPASAQSSAPVSGGQPTSPDEAGAPPETPNADPGAETPTADPGAETPTADPGAETPTADPGAETPNADPGAETPTADPGAETPTADPGAETPTADDGADPDPLAEPPELEPPATGPDPEPADEPTWAHYTDEEEQPSASLGWTLRLDFEGGPAGSPAGGPDGFDDAFGRSTLTDQQRFTGDQAARLEILEGSRGWDEWGGRKFFPAPLGRGDELWIRVRVYWPDGFDWEADPWLKFLRVHTVDAQGVNEGYDDWYLDNPDRTVVAHRFISEPADAGRTCGGPQHDPRTGRWETYQIYLRLDDRPTTEGGLALARMWKEGELLCEIRDLATLRTRESLAAAFLLGTYWNDGSPRTQHMFVDDVVITSRVPAGRDEEGNPRLP